MSRSIYRVYRKEVDKDTGKQNGKALCLKEIKNKKEALYFFAVLTKKYPDHEVMLTRLGKKSHKWDKVNPKTLL